MADVVRSWPVFNSFDIETLPETARRIATALEAEDGLEVLFGDMQSALSAQLCETGYALACEMAAADGVLTDEEMQVLELVPPPRQRHARRRGGGTGMGSYGDQDGEWIDGEWYPSRNFGQEPKAKRTRQERSEENLYGIFADGGDSSEDDRPGKGRGGKRGKGGKGGGGPMGPAPAFISSSVQAGTMKGEVVEPKVRLRVRPYYSHCSTFMTQIYKLLQFVITK